MASVPRAAAVSKWFSPIARGLALHQFLCGGNSGLDLTGGIKCRDARAVQQEHVAALRLPLRQRFVELRVDLRRFRLLALKGENAAELRQDAWHSTGVSSPIPRVRWISSAERVSFSASS